MSYTSAEISPFEQIMIENAFKRCYGLREIVKADEPGAIAELAHQTGFRFSYLKLVWEDVKQLTKEEAI